MMSAGTTTTSYSSRYFKEPLKRRLTVFFEDEKVARYENQGVPTQTDLDQMERDLKKAQADTKRKKSLWQRMFGRDESAGRDDDYAFRFEDRAGGREAAGSRPAFRAAARARRDSFGSDLSGR